jgi:hypothetical protein
MKKRNSLWIIVLIWLAAGAGIAQDSSTQSPGGVPAQPVPAYGPETAVPSVSDNPPISGLDLPNLEPHAAPLSYLQPGAHFLESVNSNIRNSLGGSSVHTITDALGSLDMQRLWSNYTLSVEYLGGVGYYDAPGIGLKQIQELGLRQKVSWKRGEFSIRDAFSYQPEGTFGTGYGSIGGPGQALSGQTTFFGGNALGALGEVPRIMNLSLGALVENLTPKSSITVTGGYGFVHFLQNDPGTGTAFIGNGQTSAQVGYNRLLGPHDQAALVYGYQGFSFSTGISFHSNVIQLMWGHRISGRLDFLIGAGPQFTQLFDIPTQINNPTAANTMPPCVSSPTFAYPFAEQCPQNNFRISTAGRVLLRYRFRSANLVAAYDHYITSGSGFFAGAESDIAHLDFDRPLGRIYTLFSNIGYSRNSRVAPLTTNQNALCTPTLQNLTPNCPGVSANVYQYGYAGVGVRRHFGREFKAYVSYQFNDLAFDNSFCGANVPCNRTSQRQVGTIGLDWTPRPIRLD